MVPARRSHRRRAARPAGEIPVTAGCLVPLAPRGVPVDETPARTRSLPYVPPRILRTPPFGGLAERDGPACVGWLPAKGASKIARSRWSGWSGSRLCCVGGLPVVRQKQEQCCHGGGAD